MSTQQGDVKLFQTIDGGNISVVNGVTEMSGGLETSVYLALFGGNENDNGTQDNQFSWWGNKGETVEKQYRSRTQYLLRSLPLISSNLSVLEDAALLDLAYLTELNIASSVVVVVTIPALNSININIKIHAEGIETEFNFTENWKAMANEQKIESSIGNADSGPPIIIPPTYKEVILDDVPKAYWRLGETSGGNANDQMGLYTGTHTNVTIDQPGLLVGDVDRSTEFIDSGPSYTTIPAAANVGHDLNFTVEVWCKVVSFGAGLAQTLYSENEGGGVQFGLHIYPSKKFQFDISTGGPADSVTAPDIVVLDTIYHIVVVGDSSGFRMYIDNDLKDSNVSTARPVTAVTSVKLGRSDNSGGTLYYFGVLDEVATYTRDLSITEIEEHYNTGIGI